MYITSEVKTSLITELMKYLSSEQNKAVVMTKKQTKQKALK